MKVIEIKDKDDNGILVDLIDILTNIPKTFKKYIYTLYELDAVLKETSSINIFNLEKKINDSENGYIIKYYDLINIANHIFQTINITIGISKENEILTRKNYHKNSISIIELIDSSVWEISSHEEALLNSLSEKFKNVVIIE